MSSIVDKVFDASQRIMRTIFRGTPNLFTTSDFNRQIEAFDYRLKRLEWFRGLETDMVVSENNEGDVIFTYTYIRVFGCTLYEGTTQTLSFSRTSGIEPPGGWGLYLVPSLVTFNDDPNHGISGAKFEDGTAQPAADNIVISSWGLAFLNTAGIITSNDLPDQPIIAAAGTVDVKYANNSGNVPDGAIYVPLLRVVQDVQGADCYLPVFHTVKAVEDMMMWGHFREDKWTPISNLMGLTYKLILRYNGFFGHLHFETVVSPTYDLDTVFEDRIEIANLPMELFYPQIDANIVSPVVLGMSLPITSDDPNPPMEPSYVSSMAAQIEYFAGAFWLYVRGTLPGYPSIGSPRVYRIFGDLVVTKPLTSSILL